MGSSVRFASRRVRLSLIRPLRRGRKPPSKNATKPKKLNPTAELGRVDKLNPDADAGKQHERGEALNQLIVARSDAA